MTKKDYIIKSLINAIGVLVYVLAVALLLSSGKNIFGESETLLIPIFMMTLLIVSATVTGLLVLGKPIHLYLGGLKKEAFVLLFSTIGWLVAFLIGVVAMLLVK